MKAEVQDPNALIGQYIRHVENARIYRIDSVEKMGAVVTEVEGMFLPALAAQECTLMTWKLIQAKYTILVQAEDVKGLAN
jgi:hypothetical protein